MAKGRTNLWACVEEIVLNHYDMMKGGDLDDSYYIVREFLSQYLNEGRITADEFDKFLTPQSRNSYGQDLWPSIEREHQLERPDAKNISIYIDYEEERSMRDFGLASDRARGFIFVEKYGEGKKLTPLTKHGWIVITGQGYSTRAVRESLKDDGRPLIVLHDCDTAGNTIYENFILGSKRTMHLDLAQNEDNVTNLGLDWADVEELNLPTQPEAGKWRSDRGRAELASLNVLKARGISEQPLLDYVVNKMRKLGIAIAPEEEDNSKWVYNAVKDKVAQEFRPIMDEIFNIQVMFEDIECKIADEATSRLDIEGEAVQARIVGRIVTAEKVPDIVKGAIDEFKDKLRTLFDEMKPRFDTLSAEVISKLRFIDAEEYTEEITKELNVKKIV